MITGTLVLVLVTLGYAVATMLALGIHKARMERTLGEIDDLFARHAARLARLEGSPLPFDDDCDVRLN